MPALIAVNSRRPRPCDAADNGAGCADKRNEECR
jgi:hypothetical protein